MVVPGAAADPLPIFPPPEEEQAALPRCHHHQLPRALCLAGGPPRGLRPLHAPAVSDLTCCCVPAGGTSSERSPHGPQAGDGPSPCVLPYPPPRPLLSSLEGSCLSQGYFPPAAFLKHLVMEAEGPPWCLAPPGLGSTHFNQGMAPAARPWGPNKDIQLHKQPCPPAHTWPAPRHPPCSDGPLSFPLQEHPVPEEHHPLEPDHSLHPTQRHVVRGAAHNEPRGAREQRGRYSSAGQPV